MQSAKEFYTRLCKIRGDIEPSTMEDADQEHEQRVAKRIAAISARDAEWQARVDTLLEDNARSEEQVKKQFATAVSLKAQAEKAEARVEKLETTIKLQENMLRIYNEEFTKQGHRLFLVQARVKKLEAALKNLLYTAEKLWDDAKPIKDSEIVRATHPIIEQARAALGREA